MSVIRKMLRQTCVYWAPADADAFGQPGYASGVQMKCRWEDRREEVRTADGRDLVIKTVVYTEQDVAEGGVLWLGLLADANTADPLANDGADEIQTFMKTPNFKAREFLREAML